jgi:hypothetical protein
VARCISSAQARRYEPVYDVDPHTGDNIEIFYADEVLAKSLGGRTGWYWWTCMAGSLPDRMPKGPFATSYLAYRDAASQWLVED